MKLNIRVLSNCTVEITIIKNITQKKGKEEMVHKTQVDFFKETHNPLSYPFQVLYKGMPSLVSLWHKFASLQTNMPFFHKFPPRAKDASIHHS